MDVVASKSGLRLESLGSWKFVLVAKAPDWKVTLFRKDDKIFYSCSLKVFKESGLANRMVVSKSPRTVVGRKQPYKYVYEGIRANRFVTPYLSCESPGILAARSASK